MKPINTILHPTDFSDFSQAALEVACTLARAADARLVLLHTVPHTAFTLSQGKLADFQKSVHREEDHAGYREEMRKKLQELPVKQVRTERLLQEGDVSQEILRTAAAISSDLIVMGTHGRNRQVGRAMGSVAEAVMNQAPCPVILVKLPFENTIPSSVEQPEVSLTH